MPGSRLLLVVLATLSALVGCCRLPPAQAPAAKTAPDCKFPSTIGAGALPAGTITGGTFSNPGSLTIPANQAFDLTTDLVIWSNGDLIVDGAIDLPYAAAPGAPRINITLGAARKIVINGRVGSGRAAPGAPATGTDAFAPPGDNAGLVKLVAGTIDVEGSVRGSTGGSGGMATAIGAVTTVGGVPLQLTTGLSIGGGANAVGGSGGNGGDVLFCADLVIIAGSAQGGDGGGGGTGTASALPGHTACACGGDSGVAGDVVFGPASQVDIKGYVFGGGVWWGGTAVASVAAGGGGSAEAYAGNGKPGGTAMFMQGSVVITTPPPTGNVVSGTGAAGGDAEADGGDAASVYVWPGSGGDATAIAGRGGNHGPTPQLPLPNGTAAAATNGTVGHGGDAEAVAGNGGGTALGKGGSSGSAIALGGANGAGVGPTGGTPSVPGTAPATSAGAVGGKAVQTGAP